MALVENFENLKVHLQSEEEDGENDEEEPEGEHNAEADLVTNPFESFVQLGYNFALKMKQNLQRTPTALVLLRFSTGEIHRIAPEWHSGLFGLAENGRHGLAAESVSG